MSIVDALDNLFNYFIASTLLQRVERYHRQPVIISFLKYFHHRVVFPRSSRSPWLGAPDSSDYPWLSLASATLTVNLYFWDSVLASQER